MPSPGKVKKSRLRAGEVAQWVRVLALQEGSFKHPRKKPSMAAHAFNTALRGGDGWIPRVDAIANGELG